MKPHFSLYASGAVAAFVIAAGVRAEPVSTISSTATANQPAVSTSANTDPQSPPQSGSSRATDERTNIVEPSGLPDRENEIIVVGLRGSIASAADKKRKAKQIVDSVVAEDAGKLPDNNVPEALARITGVQITRERGQGQDVAIRGLGGVQTTINGNNMRWPPK